MSDSHLVSCGFKLEFCFGIDFLLCLISEAENTRMEREITDHALYKNK